MDINFPERKRIRLSDYDYSSDGGYFVTICTKGRQDFFGEIRDGIMGLNEFGCVAADCWQEISKHFDFVKLYEWQIMPNHVHGVLNIGHPEIRIAVGDANSRPDEMRNIVVTELPDTPMLFIPSRETKTRDVKMRPNQSRDAYTRPLQDRSKMLLPKIIQGFKSAVTRQINDMQNKIFFQWQRSYYDHIIRDEKSLNNICEYIQSNPFNWSLDVENKNNRYYEKEITNHYDNLFEQ